MYNFDPARTSQTDGFPQQSLGHVWGSQSRIPLNSTSDWERLRKDTSELSIECHVAIEECRDTLGRNSARKQPKGTLMDAAKVTHLLMLRNAGISGYNGDYFCSVLQVGCNRESGE